MATPKPNLPDGQLMEWNNYQMLRNGIWEHIRVGKMTPSDFTVYMTLHHFADWKTGIYYGNAASIATFWNDQLNRRTAQNSLHRLRERGYIDYRKGDGTRGSFNILINKYEPTVGALKGWRLTLKEINDFENPAYVYVGQWKWSELYGQQTVGCTVDCMVNGTVNCTVLAHLQDIQNLNTFLDVQDFKTSIQQAASSESAAPTTPGRKLSRKAFEYEPCELCGNDPCTCQVVPDQVKPARKVFAPEEDEL